MSDANGSVNVLVRGYKIDPNDEDLGGGIVYHTQEALGFLDKDGADPTAAVAHIRLLKAKFPDVEAVTEIALAHVSRSIDSITEGSRFAYAISVADVYAVMIDSAQEPQQLQARVWENWARNLADQKKWSESFEKYAEGLKAVPGNERLINGAIRTIDDWADEAMTLKDWDGAVKVYDRGLEYFPENGHLKNNRQYCLDKKAEK